ncbi:hypothetical protein A3J19_00900 [Candidatus Daviesbacteria bacterium RIFCSPLOWO2_02_FULL_41_8]|uniref:HTH arsR-type domain-containing protein n=2 Tax=Candidatus Daviesiibacteriota TaxID=1752718 RepID=A0A1F5NIU2_9BACT|nr:MAG: hypothetical protein A2871_02350 [Candidatus Daviesbacteria bacterium RIFCSPHIGHO2_01_FULL_41_23]OGE77587.1 MAG: hypothetical protein A3J19_00900 [Candidatus Daviesbacteria bacterium RIFCSPLOWO2_02_FULL_41_8]
MKFKARCYRCFAALAAPARVQIVSLLQENARLSVLEIVKHFKLSQPTISHHLRYLEEAGILDSHKEGKRVYYHLSPICPEQECNIFE